MGRYSLNGIADTKETEGKQYEGEDQIFTREA